MRGEAEDRWGERCRERNEKVWIKVEGDQRESKRDRGG